MALMMRSRLTQSGPTAASRRCCCRNVAQRLAPVRAAKLEKEAEKKEDVEVFTDGPDVAPSTQEVQQLLTTLVLDTEIAELELKVGTFQLRVRRSVDSNEPAAAAFTAAPAAVAAPQQMVTQAVTVPAYTSQEAEGQFESVDEALVYVTVPKVGVFRRGKYVGGKKVGKGNVADVGDTIKKGQTLGYVEQLGTFVEVKAPQAGEIASYKAEDGDAVEYQQVVVELAPFFGGHIIGDSKYA